MESRLRHVLCSTLIAMTATTALAQTPLDPTWFNLGLGNLEKGNLASLAADDDDALWSCKAFIPSFNSPRVRLDVRFVSPWLHPSAVRLDVKTKLVQPGTYGFQGYLADLSGEDTVSFGATNRVIPETPLTVAYQVLSSGDLPPGNFIDTDADSMPDGTLAARCEYWQRGFSAVYRTCVAIEAVNVWVTP